MTTQIHPEALRYCRIRLRWTQDRLSKEKAKDKDDNVRRVSLATIKRIEAHKDGPYPANDDVADILAKTLGVTTEQLGKQPSDDADSEAALRKFGYRPLRTMVSRDTAIAFKRVRDIFGISIRSQVEMAPLFAVLLAEGSLDWRRKHVSAIEDAAANLMALAGGHFSFAGAAYRAEDGAFGERRSIAKRDLFGEHLPDETYDFGYDPSKNNPFADYLAAFAKDVEATTVTFDSDFGWKTSEGFPEYRIGEEIVAQLTQGDPDAEYALEREYADIGAIPDGLSDEDRVAWLIAQIPSEKLEAVRAARSQPFEFDIFDDCDGGDDA